jgi:hypothetical protein
MESSVESGKGTGYFLVVVVLVVVELRAPDPATEMQL